jgi:hypothetical protein
MKNGSIIAGQRVNGRSWNGNIHNRPQLSSKKKLKSQPSVERLMLTIFWGTQGRASTGILRVSISSSHYSEILTERL